MPLRKTSYDKYLRPDENWDEKSAEEVLCEVRKALCVPDGESIVAYARFLSSEINKE
jgi:hypothetical protein